MISLSIFLQNLKKSPGIGPQTKKTFASLNLFFKKRFIPDDKIQSPNLFDEITKTFFVIINLLNNLKFIN